MREIVCTAKELAKGHKISASLGPIPVVVIRAPDGSLYALVDKCLHQGGPLSKGILTGHSAATEDVGDYRFQRNGWVLKCPWHGYEYDITDGCMLSEPGRCLRMFNVFEEGGDVVVER